MILNESMSAECLNIKWCAPITKDVPPKPATAADRTKGNSPTKLENDSIVQVKPGAAEEATLVLCIDERHQERAPGRTDTDENRKIGIPNLVRSTG